MTKHRFHFQAELTTPGCVIVFADNFPPKIVAESSVISATLHETVELNITAVDNDTITFRVINKPAGSTVNQRGNVFHFSWNVTTSQKVSLTPGFINMAAFMVEY